MAAPAPQNPADLSREIIAYSNGPTILAVTATFYTVATLTVIGRGYVRSAMVKSVGADDWTMLVAMATATLCFACYAMEISHGVGKYIAVIQSDEVAYRSLLKFRQIHMIAVVVGLSLVKTSICLFLMRLATTKRYSRFLWALIAFIGAFTVACMGTLIFQCVPVEAAWDVRLRPPPLGAGDAKCFSGATFANIGLFNGINREYLDGFPPRLPTCTSDLEASDAATHAPHTCCHSLPWPLRSHRRDHSSTKYKRIFGSRALDSRLLFGVELHRVGHGNHRCIAASLPALKPMFIRVFDVARSMTKVTRMTGLRSQATGGYRKQEPQPDHEAYSLTGMTSSRAVRISSNVRGPADQWGTDRAKSSEESILPRTVRDAKMGGIMVTKQVQVE